MSRSSNFTDFVEVDPTGRYGRYDEVLAEGATKIVYRGLDSHEGIEIAWNKAKFDVVIRSPESLELIYREVHWLKTLNHNNLIKFCTAWANYDNTSINFVTEMFTSSLRQYRLRHKKLSVRALKRWCRQILGGLVYLHGYDPPVIHRDLKCDNIFVNGNRGEVKIGDLGLSAIVSKSHTAPSVGTPEFMAPEIYEDDYNELIDIYSFGMCVLEMVTSEYPYSECRNPTAIYRKVKSGRKPDAFYKVKDTEIREFVEKCLAPVSLRPSAVELLKEPFLQIDNENESDLRLLDYSSGHSYEAHQVDQKPRPNDADIFYIKGNREVDDGRILLRLHIADREGQFQKIQFPFNLKKDTATAAASQLIAKLGEELGITDQDVTRIANMIDADMSFLVPWRSTTHSQKQLQQSRNTKILSSGTVSSNKYDYAEPKPSEFNSIARRKPRDSVTNNPLGSKPTVQDQDLPRGSNKDVSPFLLNKPTIHLEIAPTTTSQPDTVRPISN